MGVVTVSSSAARSPLGLNTKFSSHHSALKRHLIVAFKGDKPNDSALVANREKNPMAIEMARTQRKRIGKTNKVPKTARAVTQETSPSSLDVDYSEAAAILENIYKLSPASDTEDCKDRKIKRVSRRGRRVGEDSEEKEVKNDRVVRNKNMKAKRLSLNERIAMKKNESGDVDVVIPTRKKRNVQNRVEKIDELVREYSGTTDLASLDWKKMRIPAVLPSSEHAWLFKLMQPMKVSS